MQSPHKYRKSQEMWLILPLSTSDPKALTLRYHSFWNFGGAASGHRFAYRRPLPLPQTLRLNFRSWAATAIAMSAVETVSSFVEGAPPGEVCILHFHSHAQKLTLLKLADVIAGTPVRRSIYPSLPSWHFPPRRHQGPYRWEPEYHIKARPCISEVQWGAIRYCKASRREPTC